MKKLHILINTLLILIIPSIILLNKITTVKNYKVELTNSIKQINTNLLVREKTSTTNQTPNEKNEKETIIEQKSTILVEDKKEETVSTQIPSSDDIPKDNEPKTGIYIGKTLTGNMTAYGRDCCSSNKELQGRTASGYNLMESGKTYYDIEYKEVRILASDSNFPLYTIIKVTDPIDGVYNAIVLDRAGGQIGLNKKYLFDLVVESQSFAKANYGVHKNIKFEVLRIGKPNS